MSSLIRVTTKAVSKALGLPDGVEIDMAFMDAADMAGNTVTFRVRGDGPVIPEGGCLRYMTIEELQERPPSLDNMGVQRIRI